MIWTVVKTLKLDLAQASLWSFVFDGCGILVNSRQSVTLPQRTIRSSPFSRHIWSKTSDPTSYACLGVGCVPLARKVKSISSNQYFRQYVLSSVSMNPVMKQNTAHGLLSGKFVKEIFSPLLCCFNCRLRFTVSPMKTQFATVRLNNMYTYPTECRGTSMV